MKYNNATFVTSIANIATIPVAIGKEVAFAGRSNAGKSRALNTITGIKSLAKISKTPGRTQLINLFTIGVDRFLVDLPGYGYAKVAESIKKRWQHTLDHYIATRQSLIGIILVMDIRHPLQETDLQMIELCIYYGHKIHILLTKADKITKNIANSTLYDVRKKLQMHEKHVSIQKFSSLTNEGLFEVHAKLDDWFNELLPNCSQYQH
jgi:GTP-binding protein